MNTKIVAFDFDMTLFDHATRKIPESARVAIKMLRSNGHIVTLSTGRDMGAYYSKGLLGDVVLDAAIEQNGTKVVASNQILLNHAMPKDLIKRVLDYATAKGYTIGATLIDHDCYTNPQRVTDSDMRRFGESGRVFYPAYDLLDSHVRALMLFGTKEQSDDMASAFPEMAFRHFPELYNSDVMEKEFSKAEGLKMLCKHYDIDMKDTIAFGDSLNDIEIVTESGIGIAMGNAYKELKDIADYVTDDIDKDGIYNACRHFGLI